MLYQKKGQISGNLNLITGITKLKEFNGYVIRQWVHRAALDTKHNDKSAIISAFKTGLSLF